MVADPKIDRDGIILRGITPEDREAVRNLYWAHYWRPYSLFLNPMFYRWQFEDLNGADASMIAVDGKGEVVSYMGLVECPMISMGQRRRGAQLMSWLSAPGERGSGIGTRLMQHLTREYDFLFGRSVSAEALAVYQKFGFRYLPECTRWLLIADAEASMAVAVEPTELTRKRLRARQVRPADNLRYTVSRTVPEEIGGTFRDSIGEGVCFARSEPLLRWRYDRHPCFDYVYLTVGEPLRAVAVVREEEAIPESRGRAIRVVEYLESPSVAGLLPLALVDYARSRGAGFVDMIGVSERYVASVVTRGGFQQGEEPDIRLPYRLRPWIPDAKAPDLLFYSNLRVTGGMPIHADLTRIYVSKGDGSCDWPSRDPEGGCHIAQPTRLAEQPGS